MLSDLIIERGLGTPIFHLLWVMRLYFISWGGAISTREKVGRGVCRGGFLSLSRFSPLALEHYRILFQMNKRCNRCVCRRVFWDYLGLFKLSFPWAKGFCGNMSWLGTRRNFQPQTRRGQEISYPIPECPWLPGFVLGSTASRPNKLKEHTSSFPWYLLELDIL